MQNPTVVILINFCWKLLTWRSSDCWSSYVAHRHSGGFQWKFAKKTTLIFRAKVYKSIDKVKNSVIELALIRQFFHLNSWETRSTPIFLWVIPRFLVKQIFCDSFTKCCNIGKKNSQREKLSYKQLDRSNYFGSSQFEFMVDPRCKV